MDRLARSRDSMTRGAVARRQVVGEPQRVRAAQLGLALGAVAAIGIYSVLAFSISRRTKEMGIRFALGAEGRKVFGLVVREGLILGSLGLAAGLGVAWLGARFLARFLYGIDPKNPLVFAVVTGTLLVVIFLACVIPARRAVRVNPVEALRQE